ncbi:hypothetical protein AAG570_004452 [Ranatra chinensis]|uniref:LON peptidase N-terminal domain and RING finger protein 1 n=1 Tax=Ranatra chinensis TaxID=642074 RepID=A0ABD0YJ35_9HEMI
MDDLELRSECIEASDFDCVLCCRTLWKPVTTPCGHTYCSSCLQRSLDYSSNCPLCMTPLTEYLTSGEKCVTQFLETALLVGLPVDYANRLMLDRAEVSSLAYSPDLPVFVCTTAFPTVSCPLFVFEPRYRLMIRRAVETGAGRFGMAACVKLPNGTKSCRYADYGTELEIRDWMLMNDGCSILSNVGMRRFRVTCRGERDGYDTARVEYFTDEPIPRSSLAEIATLHDQVMSSGRQWFNRMSADLKGEILRTFGDMPALERDWYKLRDGPAWAWWLVAILPLGPQLQVSILATTCLEKRLRAIDKTLRHLEEASSRVQPTGATLLRQHHLT